MRKIEIKFAMFLSVYWAWCFLNLMRNIFLIAEKPEFSNVIHGSVHLICLFLAACMIDELLNHEH